MSLPQSSNSQPLSAAIAAEIKRSPQQRITFARYMSLALYHPQYGYYSSGKVQIGAGGDFYTASSLGRDFGELLAVQFAQMWHNLGCPAPFYLVEMGAGNGELARDILSYLLEDSSSSLTDALKYIIIERSPALIATQRQLLGSLSVDISWQEWSDLAPDSITGCFFANELVDAFPVHLVQKAGDRLQEVYLGVRDNRLIEIIDSVSSAEISRYFELVDIDLCAQQYPDGYRTEVNLEALSWLKTVAAKLKRGYLLTIDYGYIADKYYLPARDRGTLQCYNRHRRHDNPYLSPGNLDITAHVDFTALQRQGQLCQLEPIGFTQQGLFLMSLGLGDRLNELSSGQFNVLEIFKRRDALHQLLDPLGLGGFKVLIQGKNLTAAEQSLRGLTEPSKLMD